MHQQTIISLLLDNSYTKKLLSYPKILQNSQDNATGIPAMKSSGQRTSELKQKEVNSQFNKSVKPYLMNSSAINAPCLMQGVNARLPVFWSHQAQTLPVFCCWSGTMWWCCSSMAVWQCGYVAVWQCGGVAVTESVWQCCGVTVLQWWHCSVTELQCVGVAVWWCCSMTVLQWDSFAAWWSWSGTVLQCGGVKVGQCGSVAVGQWCSGTVLQCGGVEVGQCVCCSETVWWCCSGTVLQCGGVAVGQCCSVTPPGI